MTGANAAHIGANAPTVKPRPAFAQTDLVALSRYFSLLMMRNITSDGYVIEDPASPGVFSAPTSSPHERRIAIGTFAYP